MFQDKDFPPDKDSLGPIKTSKKIAWKRAQDITYRYKNISGKINKLFDAGMDPNDICQGQLGDCWLLSALASLSNQPSILEGAFLTREWNPRGKYQLKFWDSPKSQYVTVSVDDFIPVDAESSEPVFTCPNGNEMWVMIIEKAFAKFMGSYAAIEGGYPLYAMHTITGGVVYKFTHDNKNSWKRLEMKVTEGSKGEKVIRFFLASTKKTLDSDAMYKLVCQYHREGCILSAGTRGQDKTIEAGRGSKGGIVPGHAYTILQVYSPMLTTKSDIKLVQLRNPWGSFEWDGDWSDKSPLWSKHPNIRLEMQLSFKGVQPKDDGTFYMSWDDFLKYFDGIDVCFVRRDMSSVQMDVIEEFSVLGPLVGCLFDHILNHLCPLKPHNVPDKINVKFLSVQKDIDFLLDD